MASFHQPRECLACGKRCYKCERRKHVEACCHEKQVKTVVKNTPTTSSCDDDEEFYINMVIGDSPINNEPPTNFFPRLHLPLVKRLSTHLRFVKKTFVFDLTIEIRTDVKHVIAHVSKITFALKQNSKRNCSAWST